MDAQTNWAFVQSARNQTRKALDARQTRKDQTKALVYAFLAETNKQFAELGCVPKGLCVCRLDDADHI